MQNLLEQVKDDAVVYRQLICDGQLITEYNCPVQQRLLDIWSHESYFVHMLEGRKGWHSKDGSVLVHAGETVFVRKGASIVEQYFERPACVVLFFVTDAFVSDILRSLKVARPERQLKVPAILPMRTGPVLQGFFQSMLPHFREQRPARPEMLRLKFQELLLNVVNDPDNASLVSHFFSLLGDPALERVRRVMEDNYCFNLQLGDLARLSGRSLAAFKRDVQQVFGMPPGRWIRERRLERARMLLASGGLQVSEVAFQCGFEDLSHFSRAFKEAYGATPASLRGVSIA